jgi:23S rRNA pseudouridine2605 synthase
LRPPRGQPGGRPLPAEAGKQKGPLSLARALSKFGVCSRSEAERWIEAGRVTIDGLVVRFPSRRIDPRRDAIAVDGAAVGDETERIAIALHKPTGYITSRTDPGGRLTVYELLGGVGRWVFPVGRLDKDTSGLLILTNDHRLGHRLTDPGHHVPKAYHARVRGVPADQALRALAEGLQLGDGTSSRPAVIRPMGSGREAGSPGDPPGPGTSWLEIVLTEGKNRQVRRMCAAVGHDVLELVRVAIGALSLGPPREDRVLVPPYGVRWDLAPGEWRVLDADAVAALERDPG